MHNLAETNGMWKGDEVGKSALHEWIRKYKPEPSLCENCKKVPPYDLANISQQYKRDIFDWEYLCRKCHMLKDGRMKNLLRNPKQIIKRQCKMCTKEFWVVPFKLKKGLGNYCNKSCSNKGRLIYHPTYYLTGRRW